MDFGWAYEGVSHSIAGSGGPECAAHSALHRRFLESVAVCLLGFGYMVWGYQRITVPPPVGCAASLCQRRDLGRGILLAVMCLVFGCEIGFKCATKTLIYLLNPCHLVTAVQIFLLLAPPSRLVTVLFRWHMHSMNGAVLAIAFPVVNTRLLPFEVEVYYLQHLMMLIVPFYLLQRGGVYSVEKLQDFSWSLLTAGTWLLYHFLLLHGLAIATHVNLNNMLCPAVSDPFGGQNYRVWAIGHQSLLIGVIGKVYCVFCWALLRLFGSRVPFGAWNHSDGTSVHVKSPNGFYARCKQLHSS